MRPPKMRGSTAAPTSSADDGRRGRSGRRARRARRRRARRRRPCSRARSSRSSICRSSRCSCASTPRPSGIAVPLERMLRLRCASHDPIPDAMRSGIAATAATRMTTRNTTPRALRPRPLTSSPMYCGIVRDDEDREVGERQRDGREHHRQLGHHDRIDARREHCRRRSAGTPSSRCGSAPPAPAGGTCPSSSRRTAPACSRWTASSRAPRRTSPPGCRR